MTSCKTGDDSSKVPMGISVKVVEKPGTPILAGLAPNNPFRQPSCPKDDCPLPDGSCQGKCSLENFLYKATCNLCQNIQLLEETEPDKIVQRTYIGETSRTSFDRGREHLLALKTMNKESPLAKHHLKCHCNKESNIKM